jgi:outer membrane scaffolding protein for murein synthesis (MipA/OmpV family)
MISRAPTAIRLTLALGLAALPGAVLAGNGEVEMPLDNTPDAATFALAASAAAIEPAVPAPSAPTGPALALVQDEDADRVPGLGGIPLPRIVFDDNWASVGIGAGLVPSYAGSDDYVFFPLPLLAGRIGGVGISPNGPGFALDLFSPGQSISNTEPRFSGGPAFRVRNDRAQQIEDEVVKLAGELDWAVEVGAQAGVSFPGVFNPLDAVTISAQVRWDVAGAHDGMVIEPSVTYSRLFGPGVRFSTSFGLQFVDDSFADYYFSLSPAQSVATGLPVYSADGGLNNASSTTIVSFDLDGNALNGGFNIYTVLGYSRMIGDGADTPFTSVRGDASQFIGGVEVGYTF